MITTIFSTYNGERTLPKTMDAFCRLHRHPNGWQIIAINNASSDRSEEILRSFSDRLPIKILNQPERGKNRSLNFAIPHIQGDLVIFTDDDVIPQSDWLISYENCANDHLECDLFGGAILPYWESPPEDWLLTSVPLGITYALTAADLVEGSIFPGLIWGVNMMVRKRVFDAGHRFNEDVGPSAGQYVMGSETEFNLRMASKGYKTWFCPAARVQHFIRDFQMTEDWVIQRAYRFGRNKSYQDFAVRDSRNSESSLGGLLNCPKWMLRRVMQDTVFGHISILLGDRCRSVTLRWDAAFYRGYIAQAQEFKKLKTKPARPQAPTSEAP